MIFLVTMMMIDFVDGGGGDVDDVDVNIVNNDVDGDDAIDKRQFFL